MTRLNFSLQWFFELRPLAAKRKTPRVGPNWHRKKPTRKEILSESTKTFPAFSDNSNSILRKTWAKQFGWGSIRNLAFSDRNITLEGRKHNPWRQKHNPWNRNITLEGRNLSFSAMKHNPWRQKIWGHLLDVSSKTMFWAFFVFRVVRRATEVLSRAHVFETLFKYPHGWVQKIKSLGYN